MLHTHKIDNNIKPKLIKQQWMTNGLLKSCGTKHKLYKKHLGSLVSKQEYIKYKNILTKFFKKRKTEYFNEFINQHKKDSRKVWQHINQMLGRKSNTGNDLTLMDPNKLNSFLLI